MTTDEALLTLIRTVATVDSYDGYVEVDKAAKTISVPTPYAVYYSATGSDIDERQGGRAGGRATPFQLTFVGETAEQARAAGEVLRAAISRKRVTVAGKVSGLIHSTASLPVRRDDEFTRPGGEPLFYGVDQYEVAI